MQFIYDFLSNFWLLAVGFIALLVLKVLFSILRSRPRNEEPSDADLERFLRLTAQFSNPQILASVRQQLRDDSATKTRCIAKNEKAIAAIDARLAELSAASSEVQ